MEGCGESEKIKTTGRLGSESSRIDAYAYAISSFPYLFLNFLLFDHIHFILFPIVWISSFLTNLSSGFEGNCIVIVSSWSSLCIVAECSAHRVGFYFINLNVGDVHVKHFARLVKFEVNQLLRCLVFSFLF